VTVVREEATTRQDVVAAAWALARERGLDAVSIRAVAARLDLHPTSLYTHVASKDDLYAAMWQAALAEVGFQRPAATGVAGVREVARAYFRFCRSHPELLPHAGLLPTSDSTMEELTEFVLQELLAQGLGLEQARDLYNALVTMAIGTTLMGHNRAARLPAGLRRPAPSPGTAATRADSALGRLSALPPREVEDFFECSLSLLLDVTLPALVAGRQA
jgi:AcrR family transcriptional regulator